MNHITNNECKNLHGSLPHIYVSQVQRMHLKWFGDIKEMISLNFFFYFFANIPLCHPPVVFTECFFWMFQTTLWQNLRFICQCGAHFFFFFENKCGLSWLQKGTKTRLRCITSLDSVQQLRRVLLCVRLFHEQLWLKPQWFSLNSDWWVGGGDGNVISWTMFDLTKLRWIATIHTTKDSRPPAKLTPMYYFVKQITSH